MRILKLEENKKNNGVIIKALLGTGEFTQLGGHLKNLVLFAVKTIDEPTKAIKTGARHSYARYFLLPICIRKRFKTDTHDFENIKCGAVEYKDGLFVVFRLPRKDSIQANDNNKVAFKGN